MNKKTPRMDIYIEQFNNSILLQQKWNYVWHNEAGTSAWTYQEKLKFHTKADNLIWQIWGRSLKVKVRGTSEFAARYRNVVFPVKFDIKWVLADGHWNVTVTKIPAGKFSVSKINWNDKTINLDSEDINRRYIEVGFYQYPVTHEFGHAIGNTIAIPGMHADEYKNTSPFLSDKKSIMNIGVEVRNRHIDYFIDQLNTVIPNTEFYIV